MHTSDPENPPFEIPAPLTLDDLVAVANDPAVISYQVDESRFAHAWAHGLLAATVARFLDGQKSNEVDRRAFALSTVATMRAEHFAWLLGVAAERKAAA